jgi:hypothetical protein
MVQKYGYGVTELLGLDEKLQKEVARERSQFLDGRNDLTSIVGEMRDYQNQSRASNATREEQILGLELKVFRETKSWVRGNK